ncbi:TonB-dependent receptor [Chitinophaga eiseniae]|uniref:TonB-dependent receptor n=1 Tax=Chitinophaga eiseniae TaxID=634771 RepID=A0A847SSS3_9BACT|nr:TonB-dependent receptor [Chitinophaga eiseniae]NLR80656.1 TonB-dependent receptor [Chitinophaga eiseniae]
MKHLYFILSLILINLTVLAQNGTVKGKITSADGQPAGFVTIGLKDTKKGALTDEEGQFIIKNVKPGNYVLVVSYTGTKTLHNNITVAADEVTALHLALEATSSQLNEIVVDGTRTRTINKKPVSIGKLPVPVMDLPQSVAIIGHEVLEDQQSQRMSDVVKNINGVYMASTRAGTQEAFNARGYAFSSTNMFKNGARVNSGAMPEMSSLERIEVLKGSAAILYGNVAPGAVMNMVTKQPKFNFGGEVSLRAGSFGLLKPAFDVYGPISKKVAFRVNGTFETADSYRDQVHSKRYYINPSLLFKLSDRTELVVQADYLKHDFTPDFGIGSISDTAIMKVPRNTFYGEAWQYAHTQQTTASANIRHKLSKDWSLNGIVSYSKYQRDYYALERIQVQSDGKYRRLLGRNATNEDYYSGQLDLTGKVRTGSLEHTILAGVDADRYLTGNYVYTVPTVLPGTTGVYDSINVFDPAKYNRRTDLPSSALSTVTNNPINRVGVYVQDLVSISEKLKVLAGVRYSYLQTEATAAYDFKGGKTVGKGKYDQAFSPRFGIVYKPIANTAIFASYSTSFTPNTGNDIYGETLKPSIISQYEAGVKNDFFNGLLSVNVTAYRIRNNNYAQTAPYLKDGAQNNNTLIKTLIGETLSQGVELDIAGHPLPGLDVVAGYSYNNMTIEKTSGLKGSSIEGERLVGNPNHTANASAFYTLQQTKLKGLKFGAGFYYIGQRYAGWNNTVGQSQPFSRLISVPGFSTLDLSAGYNFKRFAVMAKVSNVTNTYNYYVHENYSINPIPPTQFTGTVSYKF